MNISRENENGVEKRRMQLINKNLNDIYFYFNNFDVVCGSASEVSRYFPLITAQRQELALLPCFIVMK
ncbi:hypothetical protein AC408_08660 [Salmonella enterica subsp. enterica]|nr:hypothetical protein [Salmonella enterica]EAW1595247.1 hypothetical protein [Salmonella enterica subsp. enterica]EBS0274813.1 hypothetical protein [Salmonella enterica subsp. enterica serovar Waycross]EBY5609172.1 hypothetical protein [Salmonella enterica subsp. enterica serovar Chicago]MIG53265.1 hypothetical protein [Salmonella enterica subsp. enterica serovar Warragul]MJU51345.1 hypothetical protein [Salmonella enterica subsp. enterica serovar Coquilhatville]